MMTTVFLVNHETNETIPRQFQRCFPLLLREKLFESICKEALQAASAYKRREFWRETHTPLWLMIGRIIHVKITSSRFLLDVSSFSRVETIALSSDWLEIICDWKFTTYLWVFLSMYTINSQTTALVHSSAFPHFFSFFLFLFFFCYVLF